MGWWRRRPLLLHFAYGAVVPALLLMEAHLLTSRLKELPGHLLFTIAAAVNLVLGARACRRASAPERAAPRPSWRCAA